MPPPRFPEPLPRPTTRPRGSNRATPSQHPALLPFHSDHSQIFRSQITESQSFPDLRRPHQPPERLRVRYRPAGKCTNRPNQMLLRQFPQTSLHPRAIPAHAQLRAQHHVSLQLLQLPLRCPSIGQVHRTRFRADLETPKRRHQQVMKDLHSPQRRAKPQQIIDRLPMIPHIGQQDQVADRIPFRIDLHPSENLNVPTLGRLFQRRRSPHFIGFPPPPISRDRHPRVGPSPKHESRSPHRSLFAEMCQSHCPLNRQLRPLIQQSFPRTDYRFVSSLHCGRERVP